jgi:hypothetical protein
MKAWSATTLVTSWEGAKIALDRIAWPGSFGDDYILVTWPEEDMDSTDL